MKIFELFKKLFSKKKKDQGLIIVKNLPEIDPRRPIVSLPSIEMPVIQTEEEQASIDQYLKSCSVCKLAIHDPGLDDIQSIICTLNPNKPVIKEVQGTCPSHECKYKNLKVIVDKGNLMEYDSDKAGFIKSNKIPDKAITEIGENEWQQ